MRTYVRIGTFDPQMSSTARRSRAPDGPVGGSVAPARTRREPRDGACSRLAGFVSDAPPRCQSRAVRASEWRPGRARPRTARTASPGERASTRLPGSANAAPPSVLSPSSSLTPPSSARAERFVVSRTKCPIGAGGCQAVGARSRGRAGGPGSDARRLCRQARRGDVRAGRRGRGIGAGNRRLRLWRRRSGRRLTGRWNRWRGVAARRGWSGREGVGAWWVRRWSRRGWNGRDRVGAWRVRRWSRRRRCGHARPARAGCARYRRVVAGQPYAHAS